MPASFADLTPEQRAAALAKAARVRAHQSAVKEELRGKQATLPEVLRRAEHDEIVKNMRVLQLLKAVPGIGPAKAKIIMEDCAIAENRRVRGLTPRQKEALNGAIP